MRTLPTILTENVKLANHLTVVACFDWFNSQATIANLKMMDCAESVPVRYTEFAEAREQRSFYRGLASDLRHKWNYSL